MKTYSDANLRIDIAKICISAADVATGGEWRRGMTRTASGWMDIAVVASEVSQIVRNMGGMTQVAATAAAIGIGVPMFFSLILKRPVAWIKDVLGGTRNNARPAPFRDIDRYPEGEGDPGTDKWHDMLPDDFDQVPDGFYNENPSMSDSYFNRMKGGYRDKRSEYGLDKMRNVPLQSSTFPQAMNSFDQRTRAASKGHKLVRLAELSQGGDLLTRGLNPHLHSVFNPASQEQFAAQGVVGGFYNQVTPGGPMYDPTGAYMRTDPISWGSGGNRMEQNLLRMRAMRDMYGKTAEVSAAIGLGQIAVELQSGRMSPEKAKMAVQGWRNILIYSNGMSEEQADAVIQKAFDTSFSRSVPFDNTSRIRGGLPNLTQEQWNNPTDPMRESQWWDRDRGRVFDVARQMQEGAPGGSQINRYPIPGFNSNNNFVPL